MADYIVEVLLDSPTVAIASLDPGYEVEVVLGNALLTGEPSDAVTVEVITLAPDTNAYIEGMDFTRQGTLSVQTGTSERPITGGTFAVVSIAARVQTVPTGSSIILDVKKNGVTIFATPGDRPTIVAGSKDAVVGSWGNVSLTTGDYLTVDIIQIGSSAPGANLVVPIRLCKVA